MITAKDRTYELEQRLKAIHVCSEDTCSFWQKRKDTVFNIKTCFYCEHYKSKENVETSGFCMYKRIEN